MNWWAKATEKGDVVYVCSPRGVGETRWTQKNPPNYVERSLALLGSTVDTGRVRDVVAVARFLKEKTGPDTRVRLAGREGAAVVAAYAALLEPTVAGLVIDQPPLSHMETGAPQFLNVLRVCDIPEILGMLAPRPLAIYVDEKLQLDAVKQIYESARAADQLRIQ